MCVYLYLFRSKNSFQLIGELSFFLFSFRIRDITKMTKHVVVEVEKRTKAKAKINTISKRFG